MAPRKKASGVKGRSKGKNRSDGDPADHVDVSKSKDGDISEYEKVRSDRIRENNARLAELGLQSLTSLVLDQKAQEPSATVPAAVRRSERIRRNAAGVGSKESGGLLSFSDTEADVLGDENDEEMIVARLMDQDNGDDYVPPGNASSSQSDDDDVEFTCEDEDAFLNSRPSKRKRSTEINSISEVDSQSQLEEDAIALQQAIALSLEQPSPVSEHSGRSKASSSGRQSKQRKRPVGFQLHMGEIDALYYAIVDTGRGLSLRELQRVASAHDFTWKRYELQEMISVFDTDKDGTLSLAEFRNIAARCHIMEDGNSQAVH